MNCAAAASRVLGSLPRIRRRQSALAPLRLSGPAGVARRGGLSLKRSQLNNWLFPGVGLGICHSGSLGPALCPSVIGWLPSGAQREVLSSWGESQSLANEWEWVPGERKD